MKNNTAARETKEKGEMEQPKVISIEGVEYIRKDEAKSEKIAGDYKIVRTYSAGVFAGILESRIGQEVVMRNARRLWQWSGAASLSQLATEGTSNPDGCKFPQEVDKVILTQAIEIIDVTEKAKKSIAAVKVWKA